jgi:hypothetical protein
MMRKFRDKIPSDVITLIPGGAIKIGKEKRQAEKGK